MDSYTIYMKYDILITGENMEYLQLFDENGNPLEENIARVDKKRTPVGKYIKTVIVYIQNSKGELLIQKTSPQKGSDWATTGGHIPFGVSSIDTMHNEILEELGFDIPKEQLQLIQTEKVESYAIQDDYYLKMDIDIDSLTLQKEEVDYVKWMTVEEIQQLISEQNFRLGNIPFFQYLLEQKII